MILQKLLGDYPVRTFRDRYLFAQPYSQPNGCKEFVGLGSRAAFERILWAAGADVFVGEESASSVSSANPRSWSEAETVLARGTTIAIRHAERHDPGLAALAGQFHAEFKSPIDIQFFCTPAGRGGFSWHYDAEEVFVLQTEGVKDWWLRKNTVNPWPLVDCLPLDMQYEREIMPAMKCTLSAGDWLYVPNGYWHRTAAQELSFSLSVGIMAASAIDLLDFLRNRLVHSLRWRQRLATDDQQMTAEEQGRHKEMLSDLAKDLTKLFSDGATIREFWKSRAT